MGLWWTGAVYGVVLAVAGTSVFDHPVRFIFLMLVLIVTETIVRAVTH